METAGPHSAHLVTRSPDVLNLPPFAVTLFPDKEVFHG